VEARLTAFCALATLMAAAATSSLA